MKRFMLVAVAFSLVGSAAFAEDKVVRESDKTVFRKKTVIDFTDVAIDGELTKPEGSYSVSKKKTTFKTLIKLRDNFNPELQKSVDNL
jgi:opacity protein-like surface antigen